MSFHKHGPYSFTVVVARMVGIGGHNFVADITALRRHDPSGAASRLAVPIIPAQYGATAPEAESRAAEIMTLWLSLHSPTALAEPETPLVKSA